MVIYENEMI